jgi:putative transposase
LGGSSLSLGVFWFNRKRNNKIKDYFHKASRYIVNQLVNQSINTLIIGKNDGWKQETNIGKVNNQNFVNIPH